MENFNTRLQRILTAVQLGKPDRVPFVSSGSAVNARITGLPLSEYCSNMPANCEANLKGIEMYCQPDGVQVTIFQPDCLPTLWLSPMAVPGRELPENELWQMKEQETVTQEDYDTILKTGFAPWYGQMMAERLGNPLARCQGFFEYMGPSIGRFAEAGYPCVCGGNFYAPFEMFCGGRTLMNFLVDDLLEIPDKVEAVLDQAQAFNLANWENQLKNPATRPIAVWVGGWRGTPGILNPELFQRFVWRHMKEVAEMCLKYDVIPMFHLDSDWTNGLHYFRELPKGRCILSLDGTTDIFNAKKVIGDHCCIMGDVPASLLAFGTPEEVTAYCKRLINEVGPAGFILSSGCDAPYNAKLENLKAMADSVYSE